MIPKLKGPPESPGWYWSVENFTNWGRSVYHVSELGGGHDHHELSYEQAAQMDCEWYGPIEAPEE